MSRVAVLLPSLYRAYHGRKRRQCKHISLLTQCLACRKICAFAHHLKGLSYFTMTEGTWYLPERGGCARGSVPPPKRGWNTAGNLAEGSLRAFVAGSDSSCLRPAVVGDADEAPVMQVFVLTRKAAETALGCSLGSLLSAVNAAGENHVLNDVAHPHSPVRKAPCIGGDDLLVGETIGTGQFGMVKVARLKQRDELFALKVDIASQRRCAGTTCYLRASEFDCSSTKRATNCHLSKPTCDQALGKGTRVTRSSNA